MKCFLGFHFDPCFFCLKPFIAFYGVSIELPAGSSKGLNGGNGGIPADKPPAPTAGTDCMISIVSTEEINGHARLIASAKAFIPMAFEPGDAMQFDWSEATVEIAGVSQKIKVGLFAANRKSLGIDGTGMSF